MSPRAGASSQPQVFKENLRTGANHLSKKDLFRPDRTRVYGGSPSGDPGHTTGRVTQRRRAADDGHRRALIPRRNLLVASSRSAWRDHRGQPDEGLQTICPGGLGGHLGDEVHQHANVVSSRSMSSRRAGSHQPRRGRRARAVPPPPNDGIDQLPHHRSTTCRGELEGCSRNDGRGAARRGPACRRGRRRVARAKWNGRTLTSGVGGPSVRALHGAAPEELNNGDA